RMIRERLQDPLALNPALMEGVVGVVLRAIALGPDQRWPTAAAFRTALQDCSGAARSPGYAYVAPAAPAAQALPLQPGPGQPAPLPPAQDRPMPPHAAQGLPGPLSGAAGQLGQLRPEAAQARPYPGPLADGPWAQAGGDTLAVPGPQLPGGRSTAASARLPADGRPRWVRYALGLTGLCLLAFCGLVGVLGVINGGQGDRGVSATEYLAAAPLPTSQPAAAAEATRPPAASLAATNAQPAQPAEPLLIGLLIPETGDQASFGVSARKGAELAVAEWNREYAPDSRRVELRIADGQCAAGPALEAARRLIEQDKVKYLVGEICSGASIPVSELANSRGVLMITPTSTNSLVTVDAAGKVKPFVFRACFIDPFQGLAMARFARQKGAKTAFVLYDPNNDYSRGLAESFEQAFQQAGGKIAGKATFAYGQADFIGLLKEAAAGYADVLYLPDYYEVANRVGQQAWQVQLKAVITGGDGWDSPDLDVKALEGSYYTNHYDPGADHPRVRTWVKAFADAYNGETPDTIAALSYDAVTVLLAAIANTGVDDPARVKDTLAAGSWPAITGPISFDALHNPVKSVFIIQIANGQKNFMTLIEP
ncbi:MAG: ABC transporter substrate-binding protein, partial [Chloroflexota bacterium]